MLFAPVLLALAFVLNVYVDSGEVLETLPRPLAVAALLAAAMQLVGTTVLRSADRGAFVAVVALGGLVHPLIVVLVLAAGLIVRTLARLRRRRVTIGVIGVPLALLFAVSVVRVVTGPAFQLGDLVGPAGGTSARSDQPDVFVVLLERTRGAIPWLDSGMTIAGSSLD